MPTDSGTSPATPIKRMEDPTAPGATLMPIIEPVSGLTTPADAQPLPASASRNPAQVYLVSLTAPSSRVTMASLLNSVAKILGANGFRDCRWDQLRRAHVQAVLGILVERHKAPSTINTYLAAMKGVALEACNLGLIDTDAYERIKMIRSVRGSRLPKGRALTRHEVTALLGACNGDDTITGRRDAAILGLLLGCGLRRAEVSALDLANVFIPERAVKLIGKGNKQRMAYLPEEVWTCLDAWLRDGRPSGQGPLFVRVRRFGFVTRDRITPQGLYHILEKRQKEAAIDRCSPHDLRRTFASSMLDNGEDIITVKNAMGHASVTTTQRYDRRPESRLRDASLRLHVTGEGQNIGINGQSP